MESVPLNLSFLFLLMISMSVFLSLFGRSSN